MKIKFGFLFKAFLPLVLSVMCFISSCCIFGFEYEYLSLLDVDIDDYTEYSMLVGYFSALLCWAICNFIDHLPSRNKK